LVTEIVQEALRRGLIVESAGTYGNVLRFLAPLVTSDAQLERGLEILKAAIASSLSVLSGTSSHQPCVMVGDEQKNL
jgi:4-aminobutyrate aminotransferase/(S)-3-amino-2-methylpropionate transaminase